MLVVLFKTINVMPRNGLIYNTSKSNTIYVLHSLETYIFNLHYNYSISMKCESVLNTTHLVDKKNILKTENNSSD
jgi:hypothetical protein